MYHVLLERIGAKERENERLLGQLEQLPQAEWEALQEEVDELKDLIRVLNRKVCENATADRDFERDICNIKHQLRVAKRTAAAAKEDPSNVSDSCDLGVLSAKLAANEREILRKSSKLELVRKKQSQLQIPKDKLQRLQKQYEALQEYAEKTGAYGAHKRDSAALRSQSRDLRDDLHILLVEHEKKQVALFETSQKVKERQEIKRANELMQVEARILQEELNAVSQPLEISLPDRELFAHLHDLNAKLACLYDPQTRIRDLRFICDEMPKQIDEVEAQLDYTKAETKITELDLRQELARVDQELAAMIKDVESIEIEVLELKQQHGLAEARIHFVPPPFDTKEDYAILETMQKKTNDMDSSAEVIEKAVRVLKMDVDEMKNKLGLGQHAYDANQAVFDSSVSRRGMFVETQLIESPTIFADTDAPVGVSQPTLMCSAASIQRDSRATQPDASDRPTILPEDAPRDEVVKETQRRKDDAEARATRRHRSRSRGARTSPARPKRRERNVSHMIGANYEAHLFQRQPSTDRASVGPRASSGEYQRIVAREKRPPLPDWSQKQSHGRRHDGRRGNENEGRRRHGRRHRRHGDDEPERDSSADRKDVAPSSFSPAVDVKQSSSPRGDNRVKHRSRRQRSRRMDELRESPGQETRRKRTPRKHREKGGRGGGSPEDVDKRRGESRRKRTLRKHREKDERRGRSPEDVDKRRGDSRRKRTPRKHGKKRKREGGSPDVGSKPRGESRRKHTGKKHREKGDSGRGVFTHMEKRRSESLRKRTPKKHRETSERGRRDRRRSGHRGQML